MSELAIMDFPVHTMKLKVCFENSQLADSFRVASRYPASLPKVREVYGTDLFFPKPPEDRPYLISSIVLSSDGKMGFEDNPSGPLIAKQNFLDPDGALADFWQLQVLRSMSDGIIMGARTLQAEPGTTSHIFDPDLLEQRKAVLEKSGHPVNIVVSLDGTDVPLGEKIFRVKDEQFHAVIATSPEGAKYLESRSGESLVLVRTDHSRPGEDVRLLQELLRANTGAIPVIVTGEGAKPDSRALLKLLRKSGMETVLVESPTYTGHCMQQGLLDEAFICYSLLFAGGGVSPNSGIPFSSIDHPHSELFLLAVHRANFLYSRQRLIYGVNPRKK